VITRIGVAPFIASSIQGAKVIERTIIKGVEIAAISLPYDHEKWRIHFLSNWPHGSDAHTSYYARIMGNL
jgi:hypothetical protein